MKIILHGSFNFHTNILKFYHVYRQQVAYLCFFLYVLTFKSPKVTTGTDDTAQNTDLRAFDQRLWNLRVASKIKITFWKIANNFIPTLSNLVARSVAVGSCCPICRGAEETVKHLSRECPVMIQVLRDLKVPSSSTNNEHSWKCSERMPLWQFFEKKVSVVISNKERLCDVI